MWALRYQVPCTCTRCLRRRAAYEDWLKGKEPRQPSCRVIRMVRTRAARVGAESRRERDVELRRHR